MAETSEYSEIIKAFASVITEAAKSPLGIVALMILLLGILAFFFFRKEKVQIKLIVFSSLLIGFVLFGYKTYNVEAYRATEAPDQNEPSATDKKVAKKPESKSSKTATTRSTKTVARVTTAKSSRTASKKTVGSLAASTSTKPKKPVCEDQTTDWMRVGSKIPDPCKDGCKKAKELGKSYRVSGFPPRPEVRYTFQCSRR
jgi:hypothetical protein